MPPAEIAKKNEPWMIVVNRVAAAGRVRRHWRQLRQAIERHLEHYEIHFTEYPAHAIELAEGLASQGHRRFISVGGDGTTHEVLTGILRAAPADGSVTLGVVPMGTGGDFKRLLRRNRTPFEALEAIAHSKPRRVDVGRVRFATNANETDERYFLNSTSFGLGGLVDKLVNETPKVLGGKTSFYVATMRALAQYRSTRVRLEIDGMHVGDHDIANVFVANGRYTGGGMLVAERAMLNDGFFDVSLIPDRGVLWMMANVGKLYDGSFREVPGIFGWRARQVTALHLNDRMGLLDVDGENPGKLDAVIEMIPLAVSVPNLREDVLHPEHVQDEPTTQRRAPITAPIDALTPNDRDASVDTEEFRRHNDPLASAVAEAITEPFEHQLFYTPEKPFSPLDTHPKEDVDPANADEDDDNDGVDRSGLKPFSSDDF